MRIRIEGTALPVRRGVQVGVQRKQEVIDRFPAGADKAVWEFEVTSKEIDDLLDVGGPYVHGRPGARFMYLSWGMVAGDEFAMFRRIKLMFGDIPTAVLRAAHDDEGVLVGRLRLTNEHGEPRAARVRPDWEVVH